MLVTTRYAGTVMEVCKVNEELNKQLEEVFVIVIWILIYTLIVITIGIIISIMSWRRSFSLSSASVSSSKALLSTENRVVK